MILTKEDSRVELHNEAHQHAYLRAGWEILEEPEAEEPEAEEQKAEPKRRGRAAKAEE